MGQCKLLIGTGYKSLNGTDYKLLNGTGYKLLNGTGYKLLNGTEYMSLIIIRLLAFCSGISYTYYNSITVPCTLHVH